MPIRWTATDKPGSLQRLTNLLGKLNEFGNPNQVHCEGCGRGQRVKWFGIQPVEGPGPNPKVPEQWDIHALCAACHTEPHTCSVSDVAWFDASGIVAACDRLRVVAPGEHQGVGTHAG